MVSAGIYPVTHVLFDMDGLLLDTERLYTKAFQSLCQKYGSNFTLDVKKKIMGRTAEAVVKIVIDDCKLPITPEQYHEEMELEYIKVFQNVDYMPGAIKLIQHLNCHRIPQAVATSSRKSSFEIKTRDKRDIFGHFEHILIASDDPEVKRGKPYPDTFLIAAQRFANPPTDMRNVLVFEDSVAGVQAGLAAGMQVVWVPDLELVDPTSEPATVVLSSLEEFDPTIFQLPKY